MKEYIDRETLLQDIKETVVYTARPDRENLIGRGVQLVLDRIDAASAADVAPVVHGEWIPVIDEPSYTLKMPMLVGYKCSICGRFEEKEEPYCNCGAKMDGKRKEGAE